MDTLSLKDGDEKLQVTQDTEFFSLNIVSYGLSQVYYNQSCVGFADPVFTIISSSYFLGVFFTKLLPLNFPSWVYEETQNRIKPVLGIHGKKN